MSPALCLTCSSSLPPPRGTGDTARYLTPCCSRPICPNCLKANPRLARYNPCLRCLDGIGVVQANSTRSLGVTGQAQGGAADEVNLDGGVRDGDVYAIGDDEDEDELEEDEEESARPRTNANSGLETTSTASSSERYNTPSSPSPPTEADGTITQSSSDGNISRVPSKYYIQPGDTLHSISLRFKLNPHIICRLNKLPPSTLRSAPHLLHTRHFLVLPPSGPNEEDKPDPEREARRKLEVAQSKFQSVTKEGDWGVARAYVALADARSSSSSPYDDTEYEDVSGEKKREGRGEGEGEESIEGRAVDRYLDDDEWEERERREGRGVVIPRFPLFDSAGKEGKGKGRSGMTMPAWMRWS
ncbi:hypothetical protein BXZ70DRAFT_1065108 [Cristinia sonorae]|uniref:LysM domain-containing protein n=1 Tax=Cristinia sonorae TaxID=1940300 RepID=A0A8K0UMK9_9AGAR|nr:hypothetical protein BXZ70DRAFT_1065108 [Cristinia sonorae]